MERPDWIDKYLEGLGNETLTLEMIREAQALKDANLPERLYKYRSVNDLSVSNFADDTVWVCAADKYNDPYECATTWASRAVLNATLDLPKIIATAGLARYLSPQQLESLEDSSDPMADIGRYLLAHEPSRTEIDIERILNFSADLLDQQVQHLIKTMTQSVQMNTKVCSFSTRIDSVVMWGHYANCHTGFAMEYTVSDLGPGDIRRSLLSPVVYHRDIYDVTKHHVKAAAKKDFNNLFGVVAAMHKSPDWSYEHEWRFIINAGKLFPDQNYPMPTPSALYLGSRIAKNDKDVLSAIAAAKGVPVYQMELSSHEFKLIPKPAPSSQQTI